MRCWHPNQAWRWRAFGCCRRYISLGQRIQRNLLEQEFSWSVTVPGCRDRCLRTARGKQSTIYILHKSPSQSTQCNPLQVAVILSNDGVLANPLPPVGTPGSYGSTHRNYSEGFRARRHSPNTGTSWLGHWRPKSVATKLGLKRTTLIHKMQKLGISRPRVQNLHGGTGQKTVVRLSGAGGVGRSHTTPSEWRIIASPIVNSSGETTILQA